jgi:hypothetical protein
VLQTGEDSVKGAQQCTCYAVAGVKARQTQNGKVKSHPAAGALMAANFVVCPGSPCDACIQPLHRAAPHTCCLTALQWQGGLRQERSARRARNRAHTAQTLA